MYSELLRNEVIYKKLPLEFLEYVKNFSRTINSNLETISPTEYLQVVMYTMHIFRILESEIDKIRLSENEVFDVEILKKYANWEYLKPPDIYYIKFSTSRTEKFEIVYKLTIPKKIKCKYDDEIYSTILPNKRIIKSIYKVFMKVSNNICLQN
ncbi:conserved hypothetical protein [Methanococcus vannielii SB]|uniref:Uncharacterized protein n=1 Tax=Methanococcus vannielii (strain ATCC 35089 / DSM 1224 / JCM 13029 / OCM 148 / SB) TaxID=406327 RepID=A6UPW2_METVS|nr:hypothetical protein [Methanococcus vannielii]ABR54534.1 conserved hypothetical protein [Methanococcus vannielii SB]